jgi:RHS repeat-associated protein
VAYAPGQEPALMIADRGFTGHEHLPWFKVINMNGRLYDPLTGQFLSADPYVQNPESTQNFNRYTYCLNNPLKFSDPSGYIFKPKEELDPPLYYYSSGCAPLGAFSYNGADIRYYETHTFVSDNNGGGQWVANSDVAEYIWNSDNGGRWSPNGNAYTFSSSDEAMAWGIEYTDENNAWSNTYFGSKEATFLNYFNEAYSGNLLLACLDPGDDPEKKSMDILTFIFSSISDGSEQVMFSNSFNTWMGKDFKIRSQNWGGNGATGGKISFSRSNAKGLDIFGKTLGYYGLWNSLSDGINGKTNVLQTGANAASDLFGIYGGIFGASWSFGWEAGKLWGPSKWGRPKPYQTPTKSRIFD